MIQRSRYLAELNTTSYVINPSEAAALSNLAVISTPNWSWSMIFPKLPLTKVQTTQRAKLPRGNCEPPRFTRRWDSVSWTEAKVSFPRPVGFGLLLKPRSYKERAALQSERSEQRQHSNTGKKSKLSPAELNGSRDLKPPKIHGPLLPMSPRTATAQPCGSDQLTAPHGSYPDPSLCRASPSCQERNTVCFGFIYFSLQKRLSLHTHTNTRCAYRE